MGPGRSIWHQPSADGVPAIYLTYDDGPNPAATPALLDVLAREGATATFFLIPKHITDETAPILRRMRDEGHAIALHSHTRALMLSAPANLARQLAADADRITRLAGGAPCPLFRPHAGWRGGQMYAGLDRAGYQLAGWSFAMWDWNWWRPSRPEKLATPPRRPRVGRRHHRHARRPSRESTRRSRAHHQSDRGSDSASPPARISLWTAVRRRRSGLGNRDACGDRWAAGMIDGLFGLYRALSCRGSSVGRARD